jgi:predicted DNA-binding transcriptional regulator YafY
MNYSTYLEKMTWLIELIEKENTGPADILAIKIGVSRRTIFRYLDELRLKGADIYFSRSKGTYYMKNDFHFKEDFLYSAMEWHC